MVKPTVYIVVKDGLVQEVYIQAPYGANTDVVICDMDTTDTEERTIVDNLVDQLPLHAHKIY